MAGKVNTKITILFEEELKTAAKLLKEAFVGMRQLRDIEGEPSKEQKAEMSNMVFDACQAAYIALCGCEEDQPMIVASVRELKLLEPDKSEPEIG